MDGTNSDDLRRRDVHLGPALHGGQFDRVSEFHGVLCDEDAMLAMPPPAEKPAHRGTQATTATRELANSLPIIVVALWLSFRQSP